MEHLPTETIKVLSTPLTSAGLKIRRLFLPPQSIKSCFSSFSHQNRTEELILSIAYPLSRSHSVPYDFHLRLEACCICLCPWSTSYFSFIAYSESPSHGSKLFATGQLHFLALLCRYSVGKLSGETLDLRLLFFSFNCRSAVFFSTGASSFLPHCQGHD